MRRLRREQARKWDLIFASPDRTIDTLLREGYLRDNLRMEKFDSSHGHSFDAR